MPFINNPKLEEFIDYQERTVTLYRHGSMRSWQKLPVSFDAMRRAVLEVKKELFLNRTHSSLADLQGARTRFISHLAAEINADRVVLSDVDRQFLRIAINDLRQVALGTGLVAAAPLATKRIQPDREVKSRKKPRL